MNSVKPLRKDGILSRRTGDEWVLYDAENKSVHIVNSTAEFVWGLCNGTHTISDITKEMHNAFDVPEGADVERSVHEVIRNFADLGILRMNQ